MYWTCVKLSPCAKRSPGSTIVLDSNLLQIKCFVHMHDQQLATNSQPCRTQIVTSLHGIAWIFGSVCVSGLRDPSRIHAGKRKNLVLTCVEDQFSGRNTDILLRIHQNDEGEPNQYLFKNSCHSLKRKCDTHRLRKFGSSLISLIMP